MTVRTHTIEKKNPKHKQVWEWEETPELLAAIEKLSASCERLNSIKVPTLHVPNRNLPPKKRSSGKST